MKIYQQIFASDDDLLAAQCAALDSSQTLVFLFGEINRIQCVIEQVSNLLPTSTLVGCTTAGEIAQDHVLEKHLVITVVQFERSQFQVVACSSLQSSAELAKTLTEQLISPTLKHLFLLCDGLHTRSTSLLTHLTKCLPKGVKVTGGLAGDYMAFEQTMLFHNKQILEKSILAVGLYGDTLNINFGSRGGWQPFGIKRTVTRSEGNVLFELDTEPALNVYKSYLGELAEGLPASGLYFPIQLARESNSTPVVRTLLGVDESAGSITFAGDIPNGAVVQLMRSNSEKLLTGAHEAAKVCLQQVIQSPELVIAVSCVGRKVVLEQLIEEELDEVLSQFDTTPVLCGFYSYGEIAPFDAEHESELHNQTMTITAISE